MSITAGAIIVATVVAAAVIVYESLQAQRSAKGFSSSSKRVKDSSRPKADAMHGLYIMVEVL